MRVDRLTALLDVVNPLMHNVAKWPVIAVVLSCLTIFSKQFRHRFLTGP